jgi:ribose/xylose/arabinose/galactoside ABC-type transport system permease subunit
MNKLLTHYSQPLFLFLMLSLIIIFLSVSAPSFLTSQNILNVIEANNYRLILAIGMTFIMASGVMDLSAGAMVSFCGVIMAVALHQGASVVTAVSAGLVTGILLGTINGMLIHYTKINFFILTLATCGIFRGMGLMITQGKPITALGSSFIQLGIGRLGGMQLSTWLTLALLVIAYPLLFKTTWGTYISGLGGNKDALEKSGIRSGRYRIGVQAFFGLLAALTALIITARLNSAEPNAGMNMELEAITAVVMGGTPITGGKASLIGTVAAVLILGFIRNGLTLMSISSDYQQWITGFLLLASVLITEIRIRR